MALVEGEARDCCSTSARLRAPIASSRRPHALPDRCRRRHGPALRVHRVHRCRRSARVALAPPRVAPSTGPGVGSRDRDGGISVPADRGGEGPAAAGRHRGLRGRLRRPLHRRRRLSRRVQRRAPRCGGGDHRRRLPRASPPCLRIAGWWRCQSKAIPGGGWRRVHRLGTLRGRDLPIERVALRSSALRTTRCDG